MPEITSLQEIEVEAQFVVTVEEVLKAGEVYALLDASTPAGYRDVTLAIADCRGRRSAVTATKKELKAPGLAFARKVDSVANSLIEAVTAIEAPLKAKQAVAKAAKKAKKEERERLEREEADRVAAERRAVEEAELQLQQEAQREQQAKLDAEREELDRQKADLKAQQDALAEQEQARLDAEREEFDRQRAQLKADQDALEEERRAAREEEEAEQAEIERIAAEELAAAEARQLLELEKERKAAMAPDMDKLAIWAAQIQGLSDDPPAVTSEFATQLILVAQGDLRAIVGVLLEVSR